MSDIRGIIFDKDGTIIDFYTLWLPVVEGVAEDILDELTSLSNCDENSSSRVKRDMLKIVGLDPIEEKIDPDGNLASASVERTARQLAGYLQKEDLSLIAREDILIDEIMEVMESAAGGAEFEKNLQETADLHELFSRLRKRNIYLGLVTADSRSSTLTIMRELEITDYFDFVACGDDSRAEKPDPAAVEEFCRKFELTPDEVMFVGDTPTDMKTARNAGVGLAVGVLCGVGRREDLESLADVLVETPDEVLQLLD